MTGNELIAAKCLVSQMAFVKYFMFKVHGRKFVENWHHKVLGDALDEVINGKTKRLIINIAPRFGKTEMAVKMFISRGLAVNPASKFIHISYSDDLACDNSEEIRDIVKSDAYQEIFPYVQIKPTTDSKKKWYTTAGGGVYATASGGQLTGFGAGAVESSPGYRFSGAIVIDDPIKPDDALNDSAREKVNAKFESTIRSRVNSIDTPIVIIMQRLHNSDLCGYLTRLEPDEWKVISIPAMYMDDSGCDQATWAWKMPLSECLKMKTRSPFVWETQYMQNPTPKEGLMYSEFKTYKEIPYSHRMIRKNYTDTADKGDDYLCSIDYIETETGNYVINILFTQDDMKTTQPQMARMLFDDNIEVANIESNNGGQGFADNVEAQLRIIGNYTTAIKTFHQSANKDTRIFTHSAAVQNMTYFPEGWEEKYPSFANQLKFYKKSGKNAHDDAPDCLTGMIEKRNENQYNTYNPEAMTLSGKSYVEIHPGINGQYILLKIIRQDSKSYVVDAYMGGMPDYDYLRDVCSGCDVQMEIPKPLLFYLSDFRSNVCQCWGRKEEANKLPKIEAYRDIIKSDYYFPTSESVRAFLNNMLSFDGQSGYEAMYVLACMSSRIKVAAV